MSKIDKILKIGLLMALALLLVLTGCQNTVRDTTTTPRAGEVGSSAPGFSLKNLEGGTISLDDYAGVPLILNFWATWCGPCRNEVDLLQQTYQQGLDGGFALLAVNDMQSQADIEQFMQEYNLSFPVLIDPDGGVFVRYGIRYLPTTLFIDASGVIRQKKIGSFKDLDEIQSYLSAIMP